MVSGQFERRFACHMPDGVWGQIIAEFTQCPDSLQLLQRLRKCELICYFARVLLIKSIMHIQN